MKKVHLRKEDILNFLNGHRVANKLIEEERKKRVSRLSKEESLHEYKTLCEFWEKGSSKEISPELEKQRVSFLIKRRKLLNRVSGIKK